MAHRHLLWEPVRGFIAIVGVATIAEAPTNTEAGIVRVKVSIAVIENPGTAGSKVVTCTLLSRVTLANVNKGLTCALKPPASLCADTNPSK